MANEKETEQLVRLACSQLNLANQQLDAAKNQLLLAYQKLAVLLPENAPKVPGKK